MSNVMFKPRTYVFDEIANDVVIKDFVSTSGPYTLDSIMRLRSKPELPRPKSPSRPRVRFWAKDLAGNGLRMIEGTLVISRIDATGLGGNITYTVTGQMYPPMIQQLVPDEIAHELLPVEPMEDGLISSEIDLEKGFTPIGFIDPDDLKIETTVDFDTWRGRKVKTSEQTTVEFSTCWVNPDVMARLMKP